MVVVLRFLSERLLSLLTQLAGSAFWAQGLAFGLLAFGILPQITDRESARWVEVGMRSSLILGGVFVAGGLLLLVLRFAPAESRSAPAASPHDALAALSLLAISGAALAISPPLRGLWTEIVGLLRQAGDWSELAENSAMSGYVLGPLFALLYTPILAALAGLALILLPALLALARTARSPRFGRLLTSALICSSVLVATAWFAAEAFQRLVAMVEPMLVRDPEPTGAQVADVLRRGADVLVRSVRAQGLILGALWVMWPFLRRRPAPDPELELERAMREQAGEFAVHSEAADRRERFTPGLTSPASPAAESAPDPGPLADSASDLRPRAPIGGVHRLAATVAFGLGLLMLGRGGIDLVRPRADWRSSDPAPGATLESAPATVQVTFDRPLATGSAMWVSQTRAIDPQTGEFTAGAPDLALPGRIARDDPRRLSTELSPRAGAGLYWVQWRAVSTGFGVPRRGSFPFAVGSAHPDVIDGLEPMRERDENQRRRRAVLLGGVIFVLLGAINRGLRSANR